MSREAEAESTQEVQGPTGLCGGAGSGYAGATGVLGQCLGMGVRGRARLPWATGSEVAFAKGKAEEPGSPREKEHSTREGRVGEPGGGGNSGKGKAVLVAAACRGQ